MRRPIFAYIVLLLLMALPCASCSKGEQKANGRLRVVTTLFPLYDFVRQVGGDRVEATLLLPPGLEPHSFEPKPEDMIRIGSADLFVYTNDIMEPWAARLLKGLSGAHRPEVVEASTGLTLAKAADTGEEHGHGGGLDPHVWLDFANAQKMVDTVAAGLARRDPAGRELYRANAEAYKRKLADLDERYRRGLAACRSRVFLHGGHYAFGYLARRYDLTYISAYALSANAEPTPGRMMELTRQVRENGLKYIFYEELISPRVAETIARETGAQLLQLHGAHNISRDDLAKGATFLSLMELNLEHLRTGLQCR